MTRRRAALVAAVCLGTLLGACEGEAWRDDRVPPFRVAPFGAGLEAASTGRRVDLVADDGTLAARYRISGTGMRVYGADAARLGRVRIARDGWEVERVDGTAACSLVVDASVVQLTCGADVLAAEREGDGWTLKHGGRIFARIGATPDGGVALTYEGAREADIVFEQHRLSVRTHADSRLWLRADPLDWDPTVLVASRADLPGVAPGDLPLAQGALAFGLARVLGARPGT